ncbi:glycosyltransferase family 1 protein [Algoriphagus kandeliae]|uniref:Glycosyltransferase family 1 protein n=1 Tax=Algoriphagus kandeliae TaxID=2562278 RepID=A0A4Y9QZP8_9BACT|nr:glycosyltransferase [Algoriphagus kandeliae]TFV97218.1 glycosyltransferase family 1 protein [Algoriphagus kandeliae]
MKFLIFSHVLHTNANGLFYGYGPYVKEMNIWGKYVDELWVLAPLKKNGSPDPIDLPYSHPNIRFIEVPSFQITSIYHIPNAILATLVVLIKGVYFSAKADHLHLRCPGNMGLLGSIIQTFFPFKPKTTKYAGNWDRNAPKPWSYKMQQWILNNTLISRKMKVLAYGKWNDQTTNILPFFTASYSKNQIVEVIKPDIQKCINLIFVGSMTSNKRPELAYELLKDLIKSGKTVQLEFLGKGPEIERIAKFAKEDKMEDFIQLRGNVPASDVIEKLKKSHFLIFGSKSEGWPKAVAEAMFWGCIPVTSPVSCVPEMLGNGERGFLMHNNLEGVHAFIQRCISEPKTFKEISQLAMNWSRSYTLETFEKSIKELL